MSSIVYPLVLRGSGVVIYNGYAYYWKDQLTVKLSRPTTKITSDFFGEIDTRGAGGPMVDIEFTEVGHIRSLVKYYPYGPSNLVAASAAGTSIFGANPVPLVIATKAGQTITFARAGVLKSPTLFLSPKKTGYGPMTFSAMNRIDLQPTNAAALKAINAAAFADASFDPTKIATDIYTATLGGRAAPYNAMGARTGFEIEPVYEIADAPDENVGIADRHITSVMWKCRFAPNNLTEAQVDAIANWQGADAIVPGQSVARGPGGVAEDLTIDADFMLAVLHAVGVVTAEQSYGVKVDRNGMIEFVQKGVFAAGVQQPLVTLSLN